MKDTNEIYEFKFIRFGKLQSKTDEDLDYLLEEMVKHFYNGNSCSQRVLDHKAKIGYVLFKGNLEELESDLNYEERILNF